MMMVGIVRTVLLAPAQQLMYLQCALKLVTHLEQVHHILFSTDPSCMDAFLYILCNLFMTANKQLAMRLEIDSRIPQDTMCCV